MAETEKKVVSGTPVSTPNENQNASLLVKTSWPHASFTVPDLPEITSEGTHLTKGQLAIAEKAAELSEVGLHVEEVK